MNIETRREADRRGWSTKHHYVCRGYSTNPPRQGCTWTPKEGEDLLTAFAQGVSVERLSKRHGRSIGAISMRLFESLYEDWRRSIKTDSLAMRAHFAAAYERAMWVGIPPDGGDERAAQPSSSAS